MTKSELLIISWTICLSDTSGLMNMFKTIMTLIVFDKNLARCTNCTSTTYQRLCRDMRIWSFFSKACIYYLLSLLIYESGGLGSWWQSVGFFPRCAHDTAAVYIGTSARRDKTHTVNPLDFDCPQHQGLPLFKSKYLTEVSDRRSAIILHFGV